MLELSSLKFSVNTDDLEKAHSLLKSLAPAMQGVEAANAKILKSTAESGKVVNKLQKTAADNERKIQKEQLSQKEKEQADSDRRIRTLRVEALDSMLRDEKEITQKNRTLRKEALASMLRDEKEGLRAIEELRKAQEQASKRRIPPSQVQGPFSNYYPEKITKLNTTDTKPVKEQVDLLSKLDLLYKDLAQGSTRWEASQLRAARALNIPLDEVKNKLIDIRKLTKDPFDSAIGSVRSVTQHFEELQNRIAMTNQGIAFTTKQLKEFSRIPFEIEGQVRSAGMNPKEGAGLAEYNKRVAEAEQAYIATAKQVNVLADAEKSRINVVKQSASAEKYIATEMQRVDSILTELNRNQVSGTSISERHATSVAKYATQLKLAGVSGQAATSQLEAYRAKIQQIEALENKRAQNRLANALAPQISDIAVSVAGGMPLHLIMMQQGLQIRDLIGQSGVAAEKLQETFRNAGKSMVTSIGGTIAALGQLVGGALVEAGAAVNNYALKLFGVTSMQEKLRNTMLLSTSTFDALAKAANVFTGVGLGAFVIGIGAMVYETVKLIGANNDLARELAMTGNVFGTTYSGSQKYIEGLTGVGVSTRDAMTIMQQMSAAGNMNASQMQLVGKAAADMYKYGGVAIQDTIKEFAKLADDPVKALSDLQIKTGMVSPEVIKLVQEMKKQGDITGAVAMAMREMGDVTSQVAKRMKTDINPITLAFIDLYEWMGKVYGLGAKEVNKVLGGGSEIDKLERRLKILQDLPSLFKTESVKAKEEYVKEQIRLLKEADAAAISTAQRQSAKEKERVENQRLRLQYMSKEEQQAIKLKELDDARQKLSKTDQPMSQAAYNENYKKIFTDKEAEKEANKQLKARESILDQIEAAYSKATSTAKEYNEIEAKLAEWKASSAGKKASPALIKEAEALAALRMKDFAQSKQITADKTAETYVQEQLSDAYRDTVGAIKHLLPVEKAWMDLQNDKQFKDASAEKQNQLKAEADAYILQAKAVVESNKALAHAKELRDIAGQREDIAFERSQMGRSGRAATELQSKYDYEKQLAKNKADYLSDVTKNYQIEDQAAYDAEMNRAKEKYNALNQLAKDRYDKEIYAMSDMVTRQKNFDDVVRRGFESMGDTLVDFAIKGKASFGDMINNMLVDLVKLEMRLQMMKMYEGAGGGSKEGFLGSLFKAGASFFTSGSGGANKDAVNNGALNTAISDSNIFSADGGGFTGNGMRIGGIDGKGGGLAILHPNETVIDHTKGQGMSANVQVNIINNSNSQVTQKESVDSRGNRKVEVLVGEMTAGEVQRSGSAVQRGIGSTFGMRPALIQR